MLNGYVQQCSRQIILFDQFYRQSKSLTDKTVVEALQGNRWIVDIAGSLTLSELSQYVELWHRLQAVQLTSEPDRFIWKWTADR
jgi:hypothetical protein